MMRCGLRPNWPAALMLLTSARSEMRCSMLHTTGRVPTAMPLRQSQLSQALRLACDGCDQAERLRRRELPHPHAGDEQHHQCWCQLHCD